MDSKDQLKALAREALQSGQPEAWFEKLYHAAQGDPSIIPWQDNEPNPHLLAWLDQKQVRGEGRKAIVVGSGLGDDAEELERRGFNVTAFDLSVSAIEWTKKRFPQSRVEYRAADLLKTPPEWIGAFDFVFEAYTVQAMPPSQREAMLRAVASLLRPGGELLLICRGREETDEPASLPWPLTKGELSILEQLGLSLLSFEDFIEQKEEPIRRFRALYRRAK
jgi:SAM-dependent methyltransferase